MLNAELDFQSWRAKAATMAGSQAGKIRLLRHKQYVICIMYFL